MNDRSVAYLGIPGSFSHSVSTRLYGGGARFDPYPSFRDIFRAVGDKRSTLGVIPVENTVAGSITENYDLLATAGVPVIGEARLRVAHQLCVSEHGPGDDGERLASITRVLSHPKALDQCAGFFARNPQIERGIFSDTASAARHLSHVQIPSLAAICSEEAAAMYGLRILIPNIEDDAHNLTRFLIISASESPAAPPDKYSLCFTLPHSPKSLFHALAVLMREEVNITKIESRPIVGKPFEYVFYIDLEYAPRDHSRVQTMLESFRAATLSCKILGCYPKSEV